MGANHWVDKIAKHSILADTLLSGDLWVRLPLSASLLKYGTPPNSVWLCQYLNLPFSIPLYGDHVSLFALLMAVSMYFYSRMNIDQLSAGPQMAGMKFMSLYFMPLFLLVLCNNFSSGLSYYYMLSNVITMIQTWVIRKYFVDEDKIYAKLKEKAAGPAKKSKFQERLDAAYKAQQQKAKTKK